MNLRENIKTERVSRTDRLTEARRPVGRVPSAWLACYPIFQDALRHGETTFRTLPQQAKFAAVNRVITDAAEQIIASAILDDIRVSYVELSTPCVVEAAEAFLSTQTANSKLCSDHSAISLGDFATQIQSANFPLIARPPCLLRPGLGIFLNGWMRFFGYSTRGDRTIPLLAIDWPDFNERLATTYC
jgi:hypothetical protein